MKDFVKNVITYVTVQKQITKNVTVITVTAKMVAPTTKLMNKFYLVLALLFALSACSVGKKCVVTDEGNVVSSYVWLFNNGKPAEIDKMNCFQGEQ